MKFTVEIASVPDRDNRVAEIWMGESMVAEVRCVDGLHLIEIYRSESDVFWSFELDGWITALMDAKSRLFTQKNSTL